MLHYQNAWQRVHETSFDALAKNILIKLANLQMDLKNLLETERLVGALANLEPSASALKTQARYAWLSGDAENATKLMSEAREQAGDRWDEADQAQLQMYKELMTE